MGNSQLGQMMVKLADEQGCTIVNMVSITSKMMMILKLAKDGNQQLCSGEEGGGSRTATQSGSQACGGHLQGGLFIFLSSSLI